MDRCGTRHGGCGCRRAGIRRNMPSPETWRGIPRPSDRWACNTLVGAARANVRAPKATSRWERARPTGRRATLTLPIRAGRSGPVWLRRPAAACEGSARHSVRPASWPLPSLDRRRSSQASPAPRRDSASWIAPGASITLIAATPEFWPLNNRPVGKDQNDSDEIETAHARTVGRMPEKSIPPRFPMRDEAHSNCT